MEWIEPVEAKSIVHFPALKLKFEDENSSPVISGHFPDSNVAWFASHNQLDVYSLFDQSIQSRHFFQCLGGLQWQVTCVENVPGQTLLLVSLRSSSGSYAVTLYNYTTSLILKSWTVPNQVTCMCCVEIPDGNYKQFLKADCYLFALGTKKGLVILLAVDTFIRFSEGGHILNFSQIFDVAVDDVLRKRAYVEPLGALLIRLNQNLFCNGECVFNSTSDKPYAKGFRRRREEVHVTATKYIPQNQSLCIGYSIDGAFQLFNMKTLQSELQALARGFNDDLWGSVLDFSFAELCTSEENSPACYLVVVANKHCNPFSGPSALLYSLTPTHKDNSLDGLIFYQDPLQTISFKFEVDWGPIIYSEKSPTISRQGMKLLACQSLPSPGLFSESEIVRHGLIYFGLELDESIYIAIFDVNQWFQRGSPSQWIMNDVIANVCPFVSFYTQDSSQAEQQQQRVLHMSIRPDSVSSFNKPNVATQPEQYYFPSAINFDVTLVTRLQSKMLSFLGVQSALLRKLDQVGSNLLMEPRQYYAQAVKSGLVAWDASMDEADTTQMAGALINVGVQNNCVDFLNSCFEMRRNLNLQSSHCNASVSRDEDWSDAESSADNRHQEYVDHILTPEVVMRRSRGRPRKYPRLENVVKRGRGRPRKPRPVEEPIKKPRGRPKKLIREQSDGEPKRPRGRPPKPKLVQDPAFKRGRGRPKKQKLSDENAPAKRPRGRPKKNIVEQVQPKRKRGRPPKVQLSYVESILQLHFGPDTRSAEASTGAQQECRTEAIHANQFNLKTEV